MTSSKTTRRSFLIGTGATLISGTASASPLYCPPSTSFASRYGGSGMVGDYGGNDFAGVTLGGETERRLVLYNAHTGETFDETYFVDGAIVPGAVEAFSRFARDHRNGQVKAIDPGLIDLIWNVWKLLDTTQPLTALSLYRSPRSNKTVGGVKNSQHLHGKACDLTHSTRSVSKIHRAAKSLRVGGVGKYSMNRFVHVDTGAVRYWGS